MAVYDAFMFFNEFDLLSVRLAEHDPFVDYFILVQGNRNHAGQKKELLFSKEDPRFKKYAHKIILVNAELQENPKSAWDNESMQRQAALNAVSFKANDVIYLSDVDEIVSRQQWPYLLKRMEKELVIGVWLRMFYYSINLELIDHPWAMPKMLKGSVLTEANISGNTLRCSPAAVITPFPCGWHFSYLQNIDGIIQKISSLAHQENNTEEFKDPARIKRLINEKKDLFGREMKFEVVAVDDTWPIEMLNSKKWKPFIHPVSSFQIFRRIFLGLVNQFKKKSKPFIKPILVRLSLHRGTADSYNGFGSDLFESLIADCPTHYDPREWRRLIEFFGFLLPEIEGGGSARQCAALFIEIVKNVRPGSKIVEVGSWKGRSSVFASRAASVVNSKLYCVDSWEGSFLEGPDHPTVIQTKESKVFQEFKSNIRRYGCDNFVICRGLSKEVARRWTHGPIDFLFIDASHDYESVREDLEAWIPHLKTGSIICGDDWNQEEMPELKGSVRKAFQDFFGTSLPNLGVVERFWAHRIFT